MYRVDLGLEFREAIVYIAGRGGAGSRSAAMLQLRELILSLMQLGLERVDLLAIACDHSTQSELVLVELIHARRLVGASYKAEDGNEPRADCERTNAHRVSLLSAALAAADYEVIATIALPATLFVLLANLQFLAVADG